MCVCYIRYIYIFLSMCAYHMVSRDIQFRWAMYQLYSVTIQLWSTIYEWSLVPPISFHGAPKFLVIHFSRGVQTTFFGPWKNRPYCIFVIDIRGGLICLQIPVSFAVNYCLAFGRRGMFTNDQIWLTWATRPRKDLVNLLMRILTNSESLGGNCEMYVGRLHFETPNNITQSSKIRPRCFGLPAARANSLKSRLAASWGRLASLVTGAPEVHWRRSFWRSDSGCRPSEQIWRSRPLQLGKRICRRSASMRVNSNMCMVNNYDPWARGYNKMLIKQQERFQTFFLDTVITESRRCHFEASGVGWWPLDSRGLLANLG